MNSKQIFFLLYVLAFAPVLAFLDNALFPHVLAYYAHLRYFMFFMFAIFLLTKGIKTTTFNSIILFLFLLFLFYIIRNTLLPIENPGNLYITSFAWIFPTIAFMTIVNNSDFSDRHIRFLIKVIKVTIVVSLIVSLFQALVNSNFLVSSQTDIKSFRLLDLSYQRNPSIFSYLGLNDLGFSFLPLFSILLGYLMKKRESGMKLLFWSLLAGLTAFLSNSRYVSFGFIIIMMQILFDSYYVKLKKVTLVLVFILPVSIFFILQFIGYDLNDYLANRLFSKDSDSSRIISFFLFLKYFPEAPFWGTGVRASYSLWRELGNSDTLMQIHIGFLSHLYEFGAVGSLLLFTIYFLIIRKFSNTRKLTGYSGSLFAFIMFLFANLTMVEYSVFFYGLMLSMVFDRYFFQKSLVTS